MKTKPAAVMLLLLSYFTTNSQSLAPSPAIMADKMNVLYLGLDNPVNIGTYTNSDKVEVTINNGTISGKGAHRIIRPANVGSCEVRVSVNKKIWTFNYRVKRMPDPTVQLDEFQNSISLEDFKKVKSITLNYLNCEFDNETIQNIKSATIGFRLPDCSFEISIKDNDLSVLKSIHQFLVPGTIVSITNVKFIDQSGERIAMEASYVLY